MFSHDQYELIDFGAGRKLERFGAYLVDRPSPAATRLPRKTPTRWRQAQARFRRKAAQSGFWSPTIRPLSPWRIRHGQIQLQLRLTNAGQVGIFPEQAPNWDWLAAQAAARVPCRVLNLFAHTGAATLALAAAGAEVVHVDAAPSAVRWARDNAAASGLATAPIRWLAEDARRFVTRELRRRNRYHGIVLDPPSYGHGPRGQSWQIETHLAKLVAQCLELVVDQGGFLLLTCHSPKWNPERLGALLIQHGGRVETHPLELRTRAGRSLPGGFGMRWIE